MRWVTISAILFATVATLAGCTDSGGEEQFPSPTLRQPTLRLPTLVTHTPTTTRPPMNTPSGSVEARGQYPLTLAEAQGLAGAGHLVGGLVANGEVRVQKATVTEWENVTRTEQVCKDRWDTYEGRTKYSCKFESIQKREPVTKAKFYVSGPGMVTNTYDTVAQAFSRIGPTNYWRRVT